MNEQKLKTVQQWRTALQEAARTAVEALAFETPINKAVPSLDERSEILGAAINKIRELVRPEPKTVAFLEEEAWYRMKREAKPSGEYRTPKDAIDFVTANPPLDIPPADEPQMVPGEQPWKAIESDSCGIIRHNGIVRAWAIRENAGVEVFAKQHFVDGKPSACWSFTGTVDCEKVIIGSIFGGRNKANQIVRFIRNGLLASRLRLKHKRMNRQAKAAAVAAVPKVPNVPAAPHPAPLSPEEELADTIKRQKETEA
jgi:hypothetical protein